MKRYREYIREDLNDSLVPEIAQSSAAQEAAILNLKYVGFGRYENPATGQITHIAHGDKLVPFSKAVKTNTYQVQNADDFATLAENQNQQLEIDHGQLVKSYSPDRFNERELDAIKYFTDVGHDNITDRLLSLPGGLMSSDIQPTSPDDIVPQMIQALDTAVRKTPSPINTFGYAVISPEAKVDLSPGSGIAIKSYLTTTLDIGYAIQNLPEGASYYTILQILIPVDSPGAYIEDYSSEPGTYNFILPRDTVLDVVSGPKKLKGTAQIAATQGLPDPTITVYFFNCHVR